MSKAIEKNKYKVAIKRLALKFIGNLCVQSKIMIRIKWTYPSLPPFTVFLIAEKLPSILTLDFQTSRLFCGKIRVIA